MRTKLSYESKLRRSIFFNFIIGSVLTTSLIIIGSLVSLFIWQSHELEKSYNQIQQLFVAEDTQMQQLFTRLESENLAELLDKGAGSERVFGHFYSLFNRENYWLLLTDLQGEMKFSTSQERLNQSTLPQYVKLLAQNGVIDTQHKITRDVSGSTYYIQARPLNYQGKTVGYGFLLTNNSQVDVQLSNVASRFVVADQYRNVLVTNNPQFITGTIPKVRTEVFDKAYYFFEHTLLLTKKVELLPNVYVYLYAPFLNVSSFFSIFVGLALFLLVVHVIQTRLLAKRIAHRQSATIKRLVQETKLIENGYKFYLTVPDDLDFAYLTGHINQMMDQIQSLYNKSLMITRQKALAEKKMLEAQFNPHFLYNTLEAIRITSQFSLPVADRLILGLNRILRYSLQDSDQLPSLHEDMDKINDYLTILKVRFDQFDYEMTNQIVDESFTVPKLFLMPLVENAIKYGMEGRNDLRLVIRAQKVGTQYVFQVLSNGPAFAQDVNDIIQSQQQTNHTYHGLANTYLRLSLHYQTVRFENVEEQILSGVQITLEGTAEYV